MIAIPRKRNLPARETIERKRSFRCHVQWRAGSEECISDLKRGYSWNHIHLDGIKGALIWRGHGIFAHNLVKTAVLVN